ncbi:uncharacterized protein PHACADRAFT_23900 [Phanerochaete carnosa HHB-10118-sp]|uniref:Uncharacterized protein n=1 Tax=Phanerochaete carnosa (strain HHB-10118-sp) TaxID=650164 RepID=K5XCA9_PHACS|nr:uncharacterized protein PHACADRAFT_23900 [Phanerochaete carnosa HHB-10118-sp]EKM60627.1 hypothetical protein PHACADRAFT_23900 [Phanerochaete carnosa HHB-10118-sp]
MGRKDDATATISAFWEKQSFSHFALCYTFLSLHRFTHASRTSMLQLCTDAFADSHNQAKMIKNSTRLARDYVGGKFDDTADFDPIDMVRFCYLHIRLYAEHIGGRPPTVMASSLSDPDAMFPGPAAWASLWDATNAALCKYSAEERWHAKLARLQKRERLGSRQPGVELTEPSAPADTSPSGDLTESPPPSQLATQSAQDRPSQEKPSSMQSDGRSRSISRDAEEPQVDAGSTRGRARTEEGLINEGQRADRRDASVRGEMHMNEAGGDATEDDEKEEDSASEDNAAREETEKDGAQVEKGDVDITDSSSPRGGGRIRGKVQGEVQGYSRSGSEDGPRG